MKEMIMKLMKIIWNKMKSRNNQWIEKMKKRKYMKIIIM